MKYTLGNSSFEVNGKQYLKDVGGYNGTNTDSSKDVATVIGNKIDSMINVTYSQLVDMRDNGELIPGQQYRITDYVTTTSQENTESAGHVFDIIVTADSENILNEEARAIQNDNGTYFNNSNLSAWKIWYSLDNNDDRFLWAREDGYGVIYRMIDEYGNDCPYDFKNIKFKKPIISETDSPDSNFYYTFCFYDGSRGGIIKDTSISEKKYTVYNNIIKPYYKEITSTKTKQSLNNIIFISDYSYDSGYFYGCWSNTFGNDCYNNTFGNSCHSNTFGNGCYGNTFGNGCDCNTFGDECRSNTFGYECHCNTFGNTCVSNTFGNECAGNKFLIYCSDNKFGDSCNDNTFGVGCDNNTFGSNCYNNTFGNNCESNTFGEDCYKNTFGNNCESNTFGNSCISNTFGNECGKFKLDDITYNGNEFKEGCKHNIFGDYCGANNFNIDCSNNTFGNWCYSNTFVNYCYENTFGNHCYSNIFSNECIINTFGNNCNYISLNYECKANSFGNECGSISLGNKCGSNTFGNGCGHNTFGNECTDNTFGNECICNTFGNNCQSNTFGEYCMYIKFGTPSVLNSNYRNIIIDNGNRCIYLNCTASTGSSYYQNVRIGLGVNNTVTGPAATYKTITDDSVNQTFETYYRPKNSKTKEI